MSHGARKLIESTDNLRFVSVASLWEIAIKVSIGRLEVGFSLIEMEKSHIVDNALDILDISTIHLDFLTSLPFHHKDPFDRLIISQSITEGMFVVGCDNIFDRYEGIQRIW
jgi:PIN domain nuclease of toxin-antitoxin system